MSNQGWCQRLFPAVDWHLGLRLEGCLKHDKCPCMSGNCYLNHATITHLWHSYEYDFAYTCIYIDIDMYIYIYIRMYIIVHRYIHTHVSIYIYICNILLSHPLCWMKFRYGKWSIYRLTSTLIHSQSPKVTTVVCSDFWRKKTHSKAEKLYDIITLVTEWQIIYHICIHLWFLFAYRFN